MVHKSINAPTSKMIAQKPPLHKPSFASFPFWAHDKKNIIKNTIVITIRKVPILSSYHPPATKRVFLLWSVELYYHVFWWRLWELPLDVDAVTSPRHTREPFILSLHLIEVSHISISKSSITLRFFQYVLEKSHNSIRWQR